MDCVQEDKLRDEVAGSSSAERPIWIVLLGIILLLLLGVFISFIIGRYSMSPSDFLGWCGKKISGKPLEQYRQLDTILLNIRLPRILASMMVGASLALAGTVYQGIFRNPMVSPCLLGASYGAGFGAAAGILLALPGWMIQICSFIMGVGVVLVTYNLSLLLGKKRDGVLMLVLSGIVVGSIFSSLISLTKYVADPEDTLPVITFWLLGSLSSVQMKDLWLIVSTLIVGMVPLLVLRHKLNILSFGDEEALSLGLNVRGTRFLFIVCATIITSASVSLCGIIGWVGLVVPHLTRILTGSNHNRLIPASILVGALYLMVVDNVARSLFSVEIPLGIVTSLVGAPFFIFLLFRKRRVW